MNSAEHIIGGRIAHLRERVRATAGPVTSRQKAAHTRAVNLLRVEERRLASIEAGKHPGSGRASRRLGVD